MIKRILVALSGTPYTKSAIEHAVEIAKLHDGVVTGVTIIDVERLQSVGSVPIGAGGAAHELVEHRLETVRENVEKAIEIFRETCDAAGVRYVVDRESGNTVAAFAGVWRYSDITVAGLRGFFEYGVIDNPDDQIAKVMARGVRPILAVAENYRPIRRVLVAYNGSMESAKPMKRFAQMRLWPDTKVRVVCVDGNRDETKHLLADAAAYLNEHGYDVDTAALDGDPRVVLHEAAREWGADLMVMGSAGRNRLMKLLLGDTTLHAIKHAEIALFVSQ